MLFNLPMHLSVEILLTPFKFLGCWRFTVQTEQDQGMLFVGYETNAKLGFISIVNLLKNVEYHNATVLSTI